MITCAKSYTKEKSKRKTNRQTDRTLGQMVKTKLYRQTHTKKHTHASTVAPKFHRLNFGMIRCLFRYSRDAGYINLIVEI